MASKKSTPLDDPPSASSESSESETEDEQEQEIITQKTIPQQSSSESETSESDESDEETPEPKIQTPVPKPPPSSESESSASDSASESEQQKKPHKPSIFEFESDIKSPSASDFTVKPSKKIKSFQTPEKKPTLKRQILGPSDNNINNKKSKIFSNGDIEDEKKSVIKRVWSEDDEILLLQGFIEYQLKNGYSPLSDMDGFYRFSMDSIPGNATKSQLYEKVRRLKKKFRVNFEKVGPNGEDPVFVKPHEAKIFEISKKIWGVDGCESAANFKAKTPVPKPKAAPKVKIPAKVKPKVEEKVDEEMEDVDEKVDEVIEDKVEDFETLYPYFNAGLNSEVSTSLKFPAGVVELVKEHMSLIGDAKAKEMDEKWKAIFEDEARLRSKRIELLSKLGCVET